MDHGYRSINSKGKHNTTAYVFYTLILRVKTNNERDKESALLFKKIGVARNIQNNLYIHYIPFVYFIFHGIKPALTSCYCTHTKPVIFCFLSVNFLYYHFSRKPNCIQTPNDLPGIGLKQFILFGDKEAIKNSWKTNSHIYDKLSLLVTTTYYHLNTMTTFYRTKFILIFLSTIPTHIALKMDF